MTVRGHAVNGADWWGESSGTSLIKMKAHFSRSTPNGTDWSRPASDQIGRVRKPKDDRTDWSRCRRP